MTLVDPLDGPIPHDLVGCPLEIGRSTKAVARIPGAKPVCCLLPFGQFCGTRMLAEIRLQLLPSPRHACTRQVGRPASGVSSHHSLCSSLHSETHSLIVSHGLHQPGYPISTMKPAIPHTHALQFGTKTVPFVRGVLRGQHATPNTRFDKRQKTKDAKDVTRTRMECVKKERHTVPT